MGHIDVASDVYGRDWEGSVKVRRDTGRHTYQGGDTHPQIHTHTHRHTYTHIDTHHVHG